MSAAALAAAALAAPARAQDLPLDPVLDQTPPTLTLGGALEQRYDRSIEVEVYTDEPATARAEGTLSVKTRRRQGDRGERVRSVFLVEAPPVELGEGGSAELGLEVQGRALKLGRKALRDGGKVRATIGVTLTDAAGNVASGSQAIRFTRPKRR